MALDKAGLISNIISTLSRLYSNDRVTPEQARQEFATQLANHIETYVKTGTVNTVVTTPEGTGTGVGTIT